MESVEKSFHMAGGVGDNSYTKNSSLQKKSADDAKSVTRETLRRVYQTTEPKSIGIADLGCSSGPNTFSFVKDTVEEIEKISKKMAKPSPEFRVYLNDLPSNDFNSVFQALPDFYAELNSERAPPAMLLSLYIGAYPGSFYGRLFPDESLHFIYSSASLHWLSRVPPGIYDLNGKSINKGSVYITEQSPPAVAAAYTEQFRQDFSLFLKLRSKELVAGGGMVLILLGRNGPGHLERGTSFLWEMLSRSLATLVLQGKVDKEKFDSYEVHFYAPSKEEIEDLVRNEESLELERFELLEMEMPKDLNAGGISYGTKVAMATRAIQGSMIAHHFGEAVVNDLFEIYGRLINDEVEKQDFRPTISVVVVRKE